MTLPGSQLVSRRRMPVAALTALAATLFVFLTAELLPVGALPEVSRGLRASEASVGLLLTGYAVVAGLAAWPVVALTAGTDRRVLLAAAMGLLAVGQLLLAVAPSIIVAIAGRAVTALAHGLVWAVVPVVAARISPPDSAGRATAAAMLGASAGLVLGTPLASLTSTWWGWRSAAALIGVAAVIVGAWLWFVVPPGAAQRSTARTLDAGPVEMSTPLRPVMVVCVVTAIVVTGHYIAYSYLAPIAATVGIRGLGYSVMLAAFGLCGVLGVWATGRGMDRRAWWVALVLPATLTVGLAMAGWSRLVLTLIGTALWATAVAGLPVWLQATVIGHAGPAADRMSAHYVAAFQLGIATGSAAGAAVLGSISAGHLGWVAAAVVALGGIVVLTQRRVFDLRASDKIPPRTAFGR